MFAVCGEALWDLFAVEGEGLSFDARPGGSPFNVAVGLARLGVDAALLGGVSTDPLGARLKARLAAEGVDLGLLIESRRPTTLSLVEIAPDGSPRYAFYGEGAADRAVEIADLPDLGEAWGLHLGSLAMVAEPVGASLVALARREAGRRLVTFDPNVRLNVEPDAARWAGRIAEVLPMADLVKTSAEDVALLHPGADPAAVVASWLDRGVALAVLTRGGEGAEAFGAFGRVSVPAVPVAAADTVGAGDSFMAALVAWLFERGAAARPALEALRSSDAQAMLDFASVAAAITCGRRGADPPRRGELEAMARASA